MLLLYFLKIVVVSWVKKYVKINIRLNCHAGKIIPDFIIYALYIRLYTILCYDRAWAIRSGVNIRLIYGDYCNP